VCSVVGCCGGRGAGSDLGRDVLSLCGGKILGLGAGGVRVLLNICGSLYDRVWSQFNQA